MNFFSLITRRKNFQPRKIWNMIEREPAVVFIEKSDKSD